MDKRQKITCSKYPCSEKYYDDTYKTLCRGLPHLLMALGLLVYMVYMVFNISVSAIGVFLCSLFSFLYHYTDASKYYYLSVVFVTLDYIGINIAIHTIMYDIINSYTHSQSISEPVYGFKDFLKNVILLGVIPEIIIFAYMYTKKIYNAILSQLPHVINYLYIVYMLYIYDALSYEMLLILFMYKISFVIFFTKDNKIISKYWSQHDVFHLMICITKLTNLYYISSLNEQNQKIIID